MKKYFVFFICFIFTSVFSQTTFLIRLSLQRSTFDQFRVVYQSEFHCLVLANENDLHQLREYKTPVTIIETNPGISADESYYAVTPDPSPYYEIDKDHFARYGTILDVFDEQLIMKGEPEVLCRIPGHRIQLCAISLSSAINPYISRTVQPEKPLQVNPLMQEIIDKVSPDSCARLLRDLCGIFTRDASTKYNIEELVPYLERKFLEYNCDSVYRLEVNRYDAPAVVGVRRGVKDPSLDRVCVIGAHPDIYVSGGGRHQGAYDNGCGTVGFLEAARVMKDITFENTILFVGLNAEEKGLLGTKELIDQFDENGTEIIGGAITYDMVGIAPRSSSGTISFSVYDGNPGAQDFIDRIETLEDLYDIPLNVSTTSNNSVSTDTRVFWQNGYVAAFGRGGTGGRYHTKADSINETFDSTWLARALTPGITVIADYAVPVEITNTEPLKHQKTTSDFSVQIYPAGYLTITGIGNDRSVDQQVSVYDVTGRLVKYLILKKQSKDMFTADWDYTNSQGVAVSKGIYLIKNENFINKIIVK